MDLPRDSAQRLVAEQQYEYTVRVIAWETFSNLVRGHGIVLPKGPGLISFQTSKRLNLKGMKDNGLVSSYTVAKLTVSREIIEKG